MLVLRSQSASILLSIIAAKTNDGATERVANVWDCGPVIRLTGTQFPLWSLPRLWHDGGTDYRFGAVMQIKGDYLVNRLVYERFGSKNGLVRYVKYWLLSQVGAYRRFSEYRPGSDQRVVFVCSGNICRSPLAEVYARSLGWEAKSCGLDCRDGFPADPRAREFARGVGLDLEEHSTVNVTSFEFQASDLVVLMEPTHIAAFERKVGKGHTLALAGSYCRPPTPYIHDPFNCCIEFFHRCEHQIMEAVRRMCD